VLVVGTHGGELVAQGTFSEILKSSSLTSKYLNGNLKIEIPKTRRTWSNYIEIIGARENNLQNVNVKFPLEILTVITGVSGSGKSTLVKKILFPAMQKKLEGIGEKAGQFTEIQGYYHKIRHIEYIDQNPIGRSSRSNPVTYIKAYDDIRELFAKEKLSKIRGYQPKHFSFNVDGGRCETCKGEGTINVEMVFMADVQLPCETCNGKRFQKEVLEINFEGKNIDAILTMTVDEALEFFISKNQNKIVQKIQPLQDVGLGYVQLGQSSSTLSGGEAQRIKLASFLVKGTTKEKALFIFDEPTTGLHFHDIKKLLTSFDALIEKGHSIIVIEHNLDMIKCADYIIDLGPEGGENGGKILATGTPEDVIKIKNSITGTYLKEKLKH
jgi:excinuclease ABC subunit A